MKKFLLNKFLEDPIVNSTNYSNFYDWFCSPKSLKKRMLTLVPKLNFLVKEGIINGDTHYVLFKNNCPCEGSLYDDIRISRLDNEEFKGGFCPASGYKNDIMKCNVWFFDNNKKLITKEFKNWSSFKKKIKTNQELRDELKKHFGF